MNENRKPRSLIRGEAEDAIQRERVEQDAQWGGFHHDREHTNADFFAILASQVGKGSLEALNSCTIEESRRRFAKIAAVARAALENCEYEYQYRETPKFSGIFGPRYEIPNLMR